MTAPGWRVPLDWGEHGLDRLAAACDAIALVDTLSFSTAVDVAVSAGATVFPAGGDRSEAKALAQTVRGLAAVPRGEAGFSLSPASLRTIPAGTRFVLRAVNGGALAVRAARHRGRLQVFVACPRNAVAAAAALRDFAQRPGILAAGERRRDESVRYAREDRLGAGAIADALSLPLSDRAERAADAFRMVRTDLAAALLATRSGRELVGRGYEEDVRIAAEFGVSNMVPQLEGKEIRPGPRGARGSVQHRWFDGTTLTSMPAKQSEKVLVLAEILRRLDFTGEIPEARLNELLRPIYSDFCTLRRELVDAGMLARERGIYRRAGPV